MGLHCSDCPHFDENNHSGFFSTDGYCTVNRTYKMPDSDMCSMQKNKYKQELNSSDSSNTSFSPSGCSYTTILNYILGYKDDCEALTVFRTFRETYLKVHQEFLPLLLEYDLTGADICSNLVKDPDCLKFCLELARNFIMPTVNLIKEEKYEDAILCYKNMLSVLMNRYAINPPEISENPQYNMNILGKGRLLITNESI